MMKSALAKKETAIQQLKKRIFFLLGALFVYRLGAHIPVPGLDPVAVEKLFESQSGILGLVKLFSGGALSRLSVFALGVMPYISASIIIQLLTVAIPYFEQLKKEGNPGKRKITKYTRLLTLLLASFQAFGMSKYAVNSQVVLEPGLVFYVTTVITLMTGTMFLMWLGEQITERGIGNGTSMIIFAGIVSGFPTAIYNTFQKVQQGNLHVLGLIALLVLVVLIIAFVVFVERAQRKIIVHYAQRMMGRQMYSAQKSHLPLKINISGVIPPIFASSIILFPVTISQWFGSSNPSPWLQSLTLYLTPGHAGYTILFGLAIIFFAFFYTALIFNPKETAENLKKSGAYIPGIRPGDQTATFIDKVMTRLTFVGAGYITLVSLLPEFLVMWFEVPFYFGGTSLLIIVVVVMDLISQIQAQLLSQQYEHLLKKANLKNLPKI
ncbi:MAG: preprotein translocase subunit SecY [Gammaproteobacteria bacterium]